MSSACGPCSDARDKSRYTVGEPLAEYCYDSHATVYLRRFSHAALALPHDPPSSLPVPQSHSVTVVSSNTG